MSPTDSFILLTSVIYLSLVTILCYRWMNRDFKKSRLFVGNAERLFFLVLSSMLASSTLLLIVTIIKLILKA